MTRRITNLRNGLRLEQHGCVLSEVLARPGPTHSIFDVLSAAVVAFSPGPRVAMLGFAAGGMMAPLRAMGGRHEVEAVDLCAEGFELYESMAGKWGGEVRFEQGDAVRWLRKPRRRFDAIVEDLSVPIEGDVVKPEVSWSQLPVQMARALKRPGVAIFNLLPTPGITWDALIASCRVGARPAVVVHLEDFYNRVVIQGASLGSARSCGRSLRRMLAAIGSDLAAGISIRSLPAG